ncbi:hydrolase [Massilia terrae]|uniref:Isochorismatase family protein n=1 Tax=Massilia terrae TaxID=1811224 RepID=A0ABT2D6P0_9BURK|nr:isochorismatase family protein [Massilia terrae]MCS0661013.1 isochorismatase family protein [Massilia terrae]
MDDVKLDLARTALVMIDLQHGIVPRPWAPYTGEQVVGNCVLLSQEMRNRGAMVVYVHVLLNELLVRQVDVPASAPGVAPPPPQASQLVPEAGVEATDVVVVKRSWGAFYGTELDQLLRRRGIKTILMAGIATNMGVESTARAAFDHGYDLVFAEDAMTSFSAEAHRFACENMFRRMGRVRTTTHLLQALRAGTGEA